MDVVRVRTCKGSNYIEIQLDWQYEGEKHHSIISIPLEHFRKEDMWSIVRMLLDAAENQSKKKEKSVEWISVNDRLPETGKDVIVCHKNGHVALNAYLDRRWWYLDDRNKITHWMPLPPAPKENA